MKHQVQIEIGGHCGALDTDGGIYPQGTGAGFPTIDISPLDTGAAGLGLVLAFSGPVTFLPMSRGTAIAIVKDIIDQLGLDHAI